MNLARLQRAAKAKTLMAKTKKAALTPSPNAVKPAKPQKFDSASDTWKPVKPASGNYGQLVSAAAQQLKNKRKASVQGIANSTKPKPPMTSGPRPIASGPAPKNPRTPGPRSTMLARGVKWTDG